MHPFSENHSYLFNAKMIKIQFCIKIIKNMSRTDK